MKLKVYSADGATCTEKEFPVPEFEGRKGLPALRQTILAYQANRRQGNAAAKTRSEVHYSGKKPFRQKGTGMARAGSRGTPLWRHGGVSHGPKPRDFTQRINKKMKRLAFARALFDRAAAGEIEVIERFEASEPKTKLMQAILGHIAPRGRLLMVDDTWMENVILASRNLKRVILAEAQGLNAWDLCNYDKIVLTAKGLGSVLARAKEGKTS